MATGGLAYETLVVRDPAAVVAVERIMAQHPDRLRFDRDLRGLTGAARTRALFEQMARWPDDIRETSYDRPKWHYRARIVSGWTWAPVEVGNANVAFAGAMQVLHNPAASARTKAVALCWLFHITGDMHQPLHAGHRASFRFPLTDRLGTIAWVKRPGAAAPTDMHQFWDQALDRPGTTVLQERAGARAIVADVARMPLPAEWTAAGTAGNFDQWYGESRALAVSIGYRAEVLGATRSASAAPVLTPSYAAAQIRVARFRVATAGRRLGNLLAALKLPAQATGAPRAAR